MKRVSRHRRPGRAVVGAVIGVLAIALLTVGLFVIVRGRGGHGPATTPPPAIFSAAPTHVGRVTCIGCHPSQHELWSGSHHDLAMQPADEHTVLGDFDNATFKHFDVTSTFFRRDGEFYVRTDGPDGELNDYRITHTFGIDPLQQYLVEFPEGRRQVLGLCWDTRPRTQGGKRWFHVYPDEPIPHDDELHWTGPNQNWNFMCAECHSTNLVKNYDLSGDRYDTTWSEIDVSCEACHGPGSRHLEWARAAGDTPPETGSKGLMVRLKDFDGGGWGMDISTGTAKRTVLRTNHAQIETCARCHSRRSVSADTYVHGRPLLDTHRLALLEEHSYHPDGQILSEVYVYGSFIQSRMYREGVTCSDCHDPHSLRLKTPGNALCHQCHLSDRFDTPTHHFHERGTPGAECVNCHMPSRTYMVVDPRRDHSFRRPRPDLSVKLGTPNACNQCHTDQTPAWAAKMIDDWYGPGRDPHFGEVLSAGRVAAAGATNALAALAVDREQPGIARASALSLLRPYPGDGTLAFIESALADDDPLVRMAALGTLDRAQAEVLLRLAVQSLDDPVRAVRLEAARVLAPLSGADMPPSQREALERAYSDYVKSQLANAERPESHLNLGNFFLELGLLEQAEAAYQTGLRLDPRFVQASINLADLHRVQGREAEGEVVLRTALELVGDLAATHHALGLLLVRTNRTPEALGALARAAELDRENPRFGYVYAVALDAVGQKPQALFELQNTHQRHPNDREVLMTLVELHHQAGDLDVAIGYAKKLVTLSPSDPKYRQVLETLVQSKLDG